MYVNYKITPGDLPNKGILLVDHEKNFRSGHLGSALVEYKKNCVLAFYANCSATRNNASPGHNGFGWTEFKRSTDGGITWGEPEIVQYTYDALLNEPFTLTCTGAVSAKEDEVVIFCQKNLAPNGWGPYLEPVVLRSEDGGKTWSEPIQVCNKKGVICDVIVNEGILYVMMEEIDEDESQKRPWFFLYKSEDSGKTFSQVSQIPARDSDGYGKLLFLDESTLACYMYDHENEYDMPYHISRDLGATWTEFGTTYVAKRVRNVQVAKVKGGYILHTRGGQKPELPSDFVIYTSKDGIHWDEGIYITNAPSPKAYYSAHLVMDQDDGSQRVLIQSSIPYDGWARVNIAHWILEIE